MRTRSKTPMSWGVALFVVPLIGVFAYGMWRLERWVHWDYAYKAQVGDEVRRLIKPECLK